MDIHTAPQYIRANFAPDDRIAIVALNRAANAVRQRIVTAEQVVQDQFQSWLRFLNKERHEIYVSMNTIREGAYGRKKSDIDRVRHVFLDFDNNGPQVVRETLADAGMPLPNHLIESSPGKCQAIWRVEGFEAGESESVMRDMVRQFGADPAAVDSARVLRLPGFFNHKYNTPHFIRVTDLSSAVYTPSEFPRFAVDQAERQTAAKPRRNVNTAISQSELDWAYANRALARGEDPEAVIQAIAAFRADKPDPQYYARHTVTKAAPAIERKQPPTPNQGLSHGL